MRHVISRFFVFAFFVLFTFSQSALAGDAASDYTVYENDGSVFVTFNGSAKGLTAAEGTTGAPFKAASDEVIRVFGTSTENSANASAGINYLYPLAGGGIKDKSYAAVSVSMDFLLKAEGTAITIRGRQYAGEIAANGTDYIKLTAGGNTAVNTWNRVTLVLGANGSDNTYSVYLNGEKIKSDVTAVGAYGLHPLFWFSMNAAKDEFFDAYIDNICIKGVQAFSPQQKPEVCSNDDEIALVESLIKIPSGKTVEDVLNALETEAETAVYDADGAALGSDYALSGGEVVTAKSAEGVYSFYTVTIATEKSWDGSSSIAFAPAASLGGMTLSAGAESLSAKESGDVVYKISGTASVNMAYTSHGRGYVNLNLGAIIGDTHDYDSFLMEFDFRLSEENTGVFFRGQQYIEDKTEYASSDRQDFALVKVGETYGGVEVEAGKWYRLTVISDADNAGDDAGICKVYLNGAYVFETSLKENAYGFKEFGWICPWVPEGAAFDMELDNICLKAGEISFSGYEAAYIKGFTENFAVSNENFTVYNASGDFTAGDIAANALCGENKRAIFVLDSSFNTKASSESLTGDDETAVLSTDGIYTYYETAAGKPYACSWEFSKTDSLLAALSAESDCEVYEMPVENAEISIKFNTNRIDVSAVTEDNIYLEKDGALVDGTSLSLVMNGAYAQNVIITASELESGTEYRLCVQGLSGFDKSGAALEMTDCQYAAFVTKSSGNHMPNMITSAVNNTSMPSGASSEANGWYLYGNKLHTLTVYGDDVYGSIIADSGREYVWQGMSTRINYDKFYKYTGDTAGKTSKLRLSFDIKTTSDSTETLKLVSVWYSASAKLGDTQKTLWRDSPCGEWIHVEKDIELNISSELENTDDTFLRLHIEGESGTEASEAIYIANFTLYKLIESAEINLETDETEVIASIDSSALGYAYENGNWYYTSEGGVLVSSTSNKFKQGFLDYCETLGFKTIRIGGYYSNYDFWKCSIGEIDERIPTYVPAPEWDTSREYWRSGVEYIGTVERLALAEAMGDDAAIIMCTNVWSYLEDVDYGAQYSEPLAPSYIVDTDTQTIDYDALDIALGDILDLMRFLTLTPDDERAVSGGTNWAAKRAELGHEAPYGIAAWEIGNELELRGVSASVYEQILSYVIPKIREIFPDAKIVVSGDCLGTENIASVAESVDFISTHRYYGYLEAGESAEYIGELQTAIEASSNPDIGILITEGGLDNFRDSAEYSKRTMAMCTSFAYFMNEISKYDNFEAFQYYGGPVQLCRNTRELFKYGWYAYLDSSLELAEETDGGDTVAVLTGRSAYNSGMGQNVPLSAFTSAGHAAGETQTYTLSYDVRFDADASSPEPMLIKLEWYGGSSDAPISTVRCEIISDYTSGEWLHREAQINMTIPSSLSGDDSAYLLITICGNAVGSVFSDIRVKNFSISSDSLANPVINEPSVCSAANDDFEPTALAELMRYYIANLSGEVIAACGDNEAAEAYVSYLAVKTDYGIRLFLSNLSDEKDYTVNLNTGESYGLAGKYTLHAESPAAERNGTADDITSTNVRYSSLQAADCVELPHCTVTILDLASGDAVSDSQIANVVLTDSEGVSAQVKGEGDFDVIAAFFDENGVLKNWMLKHISKSSVSEDVRFECGEEYSSVELFKWNGLDKLTPLSPKETYTRINK